MNPNPQRGNPEGDATLAIRQLARQTGADVHDLLTLYVLEAMLARIAASEHRDDFVLKGGVLLAAFAARRPTKDIDLQARRLANDAVDVAARVSQIAVLDLVDGVFFDAESIKANVIRDDDEYAGIRVKLVGTLGAAKLTIGIDVNFGDPIWPAPSLIELPRVVPLGQSPVTLLGYPLTMVLAEKIVTAIDRGEANTRWRDFADVYTLVRAHPVDASDFAASLKVVAEYRHVELRPLLPFLAPMSQRSQEKWFAWRRRTGRENELPERFAEVLESLAQFADAVLVGSTAGRWNSQAGQWR